MDEPHEAQPNDERLEAQPNRLSPAAMSPQAASRLLTAACGRLVPAEQVELDLASGAPTNPDGTINLVHYAAWLIKEMSGRGD
jgi:hypothetical protein